MNRAKDLYETACTFLELSFMARLVIGTHFDVIDGSEFWADQDKGSALIFQRVASGSKYEEFKTRVNLQRKASDENSDLYYH